MGYHALATGIAAHGFVLGSARVMSRRIAPDREGKVRLPAPPPPRLAVANGIRWSTGSLRIHHVYSVVRTWRTSALVLSRHPSVEPKAVIVTSPEDPRIAEIRKWFMETKRNAR
jgi:hypothetical protein